MHTHDHNYSRAGIGSCLCSTTRTVLSWCLGVVNASSLDAHLPPQLAASVAMAELVAVEKTSGRSFWQHDQALCRVCIVALGLALSPKVLLPGFLGGCCPTTWLGRGLPAGGTLCHSP